MGDVVRESLQQGYDATVELKKDGFEVTATPRKGGLGGFFYDQKHLYYNPKGKASRSDTVLN